MFSFSMCLLPALAELHTNDHTVIKKYEEKNNYLIDTNSLWTEIFYFVIVVTDVSI